MPLTVIKGPPNSGRTDLIQERYVDSLPHNPVLVVPSVSDIRVWEERLMRERGARLGGRIMHFRDLVSEILKSSPRDPGPDRDGQNETAGNAEIASDVRRLQMVRGSFSENWPEMSGRVRRQPGLIEAMLEQVDEFRQSMIDPDTLDGILERFESEYLSRVSAVYRGYVELLERSGWTDQPADALSAAKTRMESWSGTPIYVAGFDDLTKQQLEVLRRLAGETEVTIAINHESENRVFDSIAPLLGELENIGGRIDREMSVDDAVVGSAGGEDSGESRRTGRHPTLISLQRDFMRQTDPRSLIPDESVSIMHSTGRRGEAKAIAARIARLLDQGADPDQIAIAVANPGEKGGVFRDVLTEYSIPASLECETRAADTVVGRSVLTLIEAASPSGSADAFIRYLRGPTGFTPDQIDRLEFKVRNEAIETAAAAAATLNQLEGRLPAGWERLNGAPATGRKRDGAGHGPVAKAVGEIASEMAVDLLGRDPSLAPSEKTIVEVRMAIEIERACSELGESRPGTAGPLEIAELIASGAVTIWSTPASGAIRIASPYSLRAKRYEHLFVASLQERGLEVGDRSGPFLERDVRREIGLPDPKDPDLHELYLFASCLTVPTRSLCLSCRVADDHGKAEQPSPLIDAVEGMFPEGSVRRFGRSASQITYAPSDAPSIVELRRAFASACDTPAPAGLDRVGLPDQITASVRAGLARARSVEESTRSIAPLTSDAVLSTLGESTTFSPTALEAFIRCPYEWFFEKALAPESFGPDPEVMARGSLVHAVLSEVFGRRTGTLPGPADVEEWIAELEPAISRIARRPEIGLGSDSAHDRITRRELCDHMETYIRREAAREQKLFLPRNFEERFGMGDDPPVQIGSWSLRGSIDRIDVREGASGPGRQAIAIDYKTGNASVLKRKDIEEQKKLQLQLYMYVMRGHLDLDPVAGLYVPVTRKGGEARGIMASEATDSLADLNRQENDRVEDIDAEIEEAVRRAGVAVAEILAGEIDHDPAKCLRHLSGAAVPDPALYPSANDPGPDDGSAPAGGSPDGGAGDE